MKPFFSWLLTLIILFSSFSVLSSAEEIIIPISECGGVISSGKTYSISTAEEFLIFEEMESLPENTTVVLTNDIIIYNGIFTVDENQKPLYNGSFVLPEPIDTIDFCWGIFDGQGHTISGLYVNQKYTDDYVGLFRELSRGTVKNVNIKNSLFMGDRSTGSICGVAYDGSFSSGSHLSKIVNCFSSAIVISGGSTGGIAGSFDGKMSNCFFNGTVVGLKGAYEYGNVGGVVGKGTGYFENCVNAGTVYGDGKTLGGFAGVIESATTVEVCSNSGDVYGINEAAGFVGTVKEVNYNYDPYYWYYYCYNAGNVYAKRPSNFVTNSHGTFSTFFWCGFKGNEGDTADYYGKLAEDYENYLLTVKREDPFGMGQIIMDDGISYVKEETLKERGFQKHVVDTGKMNNGYPIPKSLQLRTVAPSITNVEYEKSFETRNTFTVTVDGRPAMIQFIEPTNGTRTYDRNHKNVTIKSYDADGNEVNSLDRTAAYEVWSIYSNMMTNVEIRTRAKYLSEARYAWESETYNFPMILANPIISMELSATSGKKRPVPATVIADDKTEKVMFKMPDNTTVTVASKATDENGNKIFTGKAWINKDGLNEIRIFIYRNNVWRQAGTLEYVAS